MNARRILIVDDNLALARLLKAQLDVLGGFVVRIEGQSTVALAAARAFRPQVMILDVMMPGMDGGPVVAQLARDPDLAKVRVVFLTGSCGAKRWSSAKDLLAACRFWPSP